MELKLSEPQKEELILNILTDSVIFDNVGYFVSKLSGGAEKLH